MVTLKIFCKSEVDREGGEGGLSVKIIRWEWIKVSKRKASFADLRGLVMNKYRRGDRVIGGLVPSLVISICGGGWGRVEEEILVYMY